ncbi:MAG: hypothetical protein KIH89_001035 [Candidatus Shapirobacteria bacterium]|nr:hypothetical protein [Candidatus Shapirobacteria bacterium]
MDKKKKFLVDSIKGKITDLIFERMMKNDPNHCFTVIPFGYEYTIPELAQYQDLIENNTVLSSIRRSPDFILIKNDKTKVYFVEVKYRKYLHKIDIFERSKEIVRYWPDTFLFLATQDGFYFDSCKEIIANNGLINKLNKNIVSVETQIEYLSILKDFIRI